jgi:hypothetical protein
MPLRGRHEVDAAVQVLFVIGLLESWFQAVSAAPLVSNAPDYSPKNISAGVRSPSRTLGRLFNTFS